MRTGASLPEFTTVQPIRSFSSCDLVAPSPSSSLPTSWRSHDGFLSILCFPVESANVNCIVGGFHSLASPIPGANSFTFPAFLSEVRVYVFIRGPVVAHASALLLSCAYSERTREPSSGLLPLSLLHYRGASYPSRPVPFLGRPVFRSLSSRLFFFVYVCVCVSAMRCDATRTHR